MFHKEDSLKKRLVVKQKTSCSHGVFCYCINFLIFRLYEDFRNSKLHEAYFENLTKTKEAFPDSSPLKTQIEKTFGNIEAWETDFKAIGSLRGIGWAMLVYDIEAHELYNIWVDEHHVGHLVHTIPLLVMDVFEHAFLLDYGVDRKSYINNFFDYIAWETVLERFTKISST